MKKKSLVFIDKAIPRWFITVGCIVFANYLAKKGDVRFLLVIAIVASLCCEISVYLLLRERR